ncbi:hypothetical protein ARMGADRAFT_1089752 [Armillaria gallica]|uniref:Uncharacterized protein n=1 Tax=Armillaria gallica TaxID=47427 RepID=A0A2H3CIU9_ARMGA|nr:hypothetical protein ARMGADRAFT_1089752 [Armillaria gallica]
MSSSVRCGLRVRPTFVTTRIPWKISPTPLHPAREGDFLNERHSIIRRLGAGFGTVGRRSDHIVSLSNKRPSFPASHVLAAVSGDLTRYTSRHEGMPFYFFRSNVTNSSSSGGSASTFT